MSERLAAADRPTGQSGAPPHAGEPNDTISRWRPELDRLWARGRAFLGTDLAIMGGAMTWVSERHLVAAISNAGGFGVIASGSMTPELLDAEIEATYALTARPFGVNLITLHPRLLDLIDLDDEVRHVSEPWDGCGFRRSGRKGARMVRAVGGESRRRPGP